jgi:GGDEF domain-containing protein
MNMRRAERRSEEGFAWVFSLVSVVFDELENLAVSLNYTHYTQLLAEVGKKMKEFFASDHVWQVLHHEQGKFYFFLSHHGEKECAFAQKFHKLFRETIWLQGQGLNVRLTVRIGLATYPSDGQTMAELLHSVDEAVNVVRNSGGDGVAAAQIGILPPL